MHRKTGILATAVVLICSCRTAAPPGDSHGGDDTTPPEDVSPAAEDIFEIEVPPETTPDTTPDDGQDLLAPDDTGVPSNDDGVSSPPDHTAEDAPGPDPTEEPATEPPPDIPPPDALCCDFGDAADISLPPCEPAGCGIWCGEPAVCGKCGNGQCEPGESPLSCAPDCCEPSLCKPDGGPLFAGASPLCVAMPDGTACSDEDASNGIETCRNGLCRFEDPHCRCAISAPGPADPAVLPAADELPDVPIQEWKGAAPGEVSFSDAWGLKRIDTSAAWALTQGNPSVLLAVLDTGCDAGHPDLAGRIVAQWDFVADDATAEDAAGHGTALATVAAGSLNGVGIVGVAPKVSILCARVSGLGQEANYELLAAAIDWAVGNGADVILTGFGGYGKGPSLDVLMASVANAEAAGVVVVAPAGSSGGANMDRFPAAFEEVLSVSSVDRKDYPEMESDVSPFTDVLAPGEDTPVGVPGAIVRRSNGSSVAAAFVAGTAALVRSVAPGLPAKSIRGLIAANGIPLPTSTLRRMVGARVLDAGRSVEVASKAKPDLAVVSIEVVPAAPLPGQAARLRVRVENRGAFPSPATTLDVAADAGLLAVQENGKGQTLDLPLAGLDAGAFAEMSLDLLPGKAKTVITAKVLTVGDADESNDQMTSAVETISTALHHVRIRRATVEPSADKEKLTVTAWVENTGNAPEPARELEVTVGPSGAKSTVAVKALEPGWIAAVVADVKPGPGPDDRFVVLLRLQPAGGQTKLHDTLALFRLHHSTGDTRVETAWAQLKSVNLIADAPWRTVIGRIPLLFFYARLYWTEGTFPWQYLVPDVFVESVSVTNPISASEPNLGPFLLSEAAMALPAVFPKGGWVVDEFGRKTEFPKVLNPYIGPDFILHGPPPGSHRILWIPIDAIVHKQSKPMADGEATGAFLNVTFRYVRSILQPSDDERFRFTTRMLAVEIPQDAGKAELPKLGETDIYVDAHNHTIAEWYQYQPPYYIFENNYAGPIEMLVASAASIGMLSPGDLATWESNEKVSDGVLNKIVTTDHNGFLDDYYAPGDPMGLPAEWVGPDPGCGWPIVDPLPDVAGPGWSAKERWGKAWSDDVDPAWPAIEGPKPDVGPTGSCELDIYRRLFGWSTGEEVTVDGPRADAYLSYMIGRHALVYRSGHVQGDFGFGWMDDVLPKVCAAAKTPCASIEDNCEDVAPNMDELCDDLDSLCDIAKEFCAAVPYPEVWGGSFIFPRVCSKYVCKLIEKPCKEEMTPYEACAYGKELCEVFDHHCSDPLCTPRYDQVLRRVSCNHDGNETPSCTSGQVDFCVGRKPGSQELSGFMYAAHPFHGFYRWQPKMLRRALSLPPSLNSKEPPEPDLDQDTEMDYNAQEFRVDGKEYVFRGLQLWNQREAGIWNDARYFLVNPFAQWNYEECNEKRASLRSAIGTFLGHVKEGLWQTFDDEPAPRAVTFRKLFMLAGSDAHGDFNYTTAHVATVAESLPWPFGAMFSSYSVSDGAFGRPRTYVFGGTMDDLKWGRTTLTDGPVLELQIDPEPRGEYDAGNGKLTWHDSSPVIPDAHTPEGLMGGGGIGDGERTTLVPALVQPSATKDKQESQMVAVRLRCRNAEPFGTNKPLRVDLLVSGEGAAGGNPDAPGFEQRVRCVHLKVDGNDNSKCEKWSEAPEVALVSDSPLKGAGGESPFKCDGNWYQAVVRPGTTIPEGQSAPTTQRMLVSPVAIVAHVRFGDECPDLYEAFTNPVWLAPVWSKVSMTMVVRPDKTFRLLHTGANAVLTGNVPINLEFPFTMTPDEVEARVMQVDQNGALKELTGGVDCRGGLVPMQGPTAGVNGWYNSPPLSQPDQQKYKYTVLRLFTHANKPITGTVLDAKADDTRLVLVVKRKGGDGRLRDGFGNPVGVLMTRFHPKVAYHNCPANQGYCFSTGLCMGWGCPVNTQQTPDCPCCASWWPLFGCVDCVLPVSQGDCPGGVVFSGSPICFPDCGGKACGEGGGCGCTCKQACPQ